MNSTGKVTWFPCVLLTILEAMVSEQASGQFTEFPTWSSGPTDRSHSVALGDVDRDGDLDLVCGKTGVLHIEYASPALCPDEENILCTWAGNGSAGFNGDGNTLLESMLYFPVDVLFTTGGDAYIVDWNNHLVRQVTSDGKLQTVIGDVLGDGPPDQSDLQDPGAPGTTVSLNHPTDLIELPDGRLLLVAWGNHKLRRYDPATGLVRVICGSVPGFDGDGGPANSALLNLPSGAAISPDGTVYVLDQRNQRIRRISTDGNIATVAGNGVAGYGGDGGDPLLAKFSFPSGPNPLPAGTIALDGQGLLYISDAGNNRIRRVDFAANVIQTIVGNGVAGFGGDGGPATVASINYPRDIEIGSDGRLYIADALNDRIRAVDLSTEVITTVAGNGNRGFSGDGENVLEASLNHPTGIAFDIDGRMYISDSGNHRIRRVQLTIRGPRIAPAVETLLFPTATLGDTTGTTLGLVNRGNEDLLIQSFRFPAPGMWIVEPLPLLVRPGESAAVTVLFAPRSGESIQGDLAIESNDPHRPVATVGVVASIRPIDFLVTTAPGPVPSDDDLDIIVTMRDSVRVDSVRVSYRPGGSSLFESVTLARLADPRNEQHLGVIPAEVITAAGIEYFVDVHNGAFQVTEDLRKIRVRTRDLAFPFSQPAGAYRMVSVPLEMEGAILGVLGDDLLDTDWRMFAYDDSAYVELPDERLFALEQGRSYWLITRNDVSLDTSPEEGISAPTDSAFALVLRSGWTQIANPFAFPVAWADVRVGEDAVGDQDVVEPPWKWIPQEGNAGTYSDSVEVLDPFEGYWVKNRSTESVTLHIPPVGASDPGAPGHPQSAEPDPHADSWRLRIVAVCAGAHDESNYAGVAPGASDAWDRFDRSDPPLAPGTSVSVYFPHSDGERGTEFLASDIRSPATEAPEESPDRFRWRFDIARHDPDDASPVEIVLEVRGLDALPSGVDALLVDNVLGRTRDLREEPRYTYFSGNKDYVSHASEARFALLVGDPHIIRDGADAPPSQTRLLQSYPNPCRTSTVIRYEIAKPSPGSLQIVDVQGRRVRTFLLDHGEPGLYEVAWRADDDAGRRVSPGIYFYRLEASGTTHVRRLVVLQ